jgi:hypothetical protein
MVHLSFKPEAPIMKPTVTKLSDEITLVALWPIAVGRANL